MTYQRLESDIDRAIQSVLTSQQPLEISGLEGGARPLFLASLAHAADRPLLIITPKGRDAEALAEDIRFFSAGRMRPGEEPLLFPAWESPPFLDLPPEREGVWSRLRSLHALLQSEARVVVAPVEGLMQMTVPRADLRKVDFPLAMGDEIDRDDLAERLVAMGYTRTELVEAPGEFSFRGHLVDLFSPLADRPVRIECFGDAVEEIRTFDPATQRSDRGAGPDRIWVGPAREAIFFSMESEGLRNNVKQRCDDAGLSRIKRAGIERAMELSLRYGGLDRFLPFFYDRLEPLFDHLGPDVMVILCEADRVRRDAELWWEEIIERRAQAQSDAAACIMPEDLYLRPGELFSRIEALNPIVLARFGGTAGEPGPGDACETEYGAPPLPIRDETRTGGIAFSIKTNEMIRQSIAAHQSEEEALRPLVEAVEGWLAEDLEVIFACRGEAGVMRLVGLLKLYGLSPAPLSSFAVQGRPGEISLVTGRVTAGFQWPGIGAVLITEEEIFGAKVRRSRRPHQSPSAVFLSNLSDLEPDDSIVHADFGIGLYRGLESLTIEGFRNDFLHIEYAGEDKLYLPVDRVNLVQKYVGPEGRAPRLDRLGAQAWAKAKERAKQSIEAIAKELVELYATRRVLPGHAFSPPDQLYRSFESTFEFEETPDQAAAIEDVLQDMTRSMPMDRLICGDVGYGKTEVAIRAAFKVVLDGKQVAVLVPTTVLAQQHATTFAARLADYPVNVEELSRFKTPKQQRDILAGLAAGKLDIIIGTHRLLSKDISFRNLGLLIIDEEHRFGVTHKERIKRMRRMVDVLTLSATPIPRTLHMSLTGIRDLSVINSPPEDRLSVRTYVTRYDHQVIREAIRQEMGRGGQAFFVHNRVANIHTVADSLRRLVPEARIAVAHGQMAERELESIMLGFVGREFDILVCTTIIESGLDIPSVNTIIINHAERLGLAQLYQLRGRVGRSRAQAYAYLIVPEAEILSSDAIKRLRVIQEATELGSGFKIAKYDLEIRGAGNLLGTSQAGHIQALGFEMYTELVERAVLELQGEAPPEEIEPEIQLRVPAYLPDDYIEAPGQRLVLYKRLASSAGPEEIAEIRREIEDRYGPAPSEAENLLEVIEIKGMLKRIRAESLRFDGERIIISFHPSTSLDPGRVLGLIESSGGRLRLLPGDRLSAEGCDATGNTDGSPGIFRETKKLLTALSGCAPARQGARPKGRQEAAAGGTR